MQNYIVKSVTTKEQWIIKKLYSNINNEVYNHKRQWVKYKIQCVKYVAAVINKWSWYKSQRTHEYPECVILKCLEWGTCTVLGARNQCSKQAEKSVLSNRYPVRTGNVNSLYNYSDVTSRCSICPGSETTSQNKLLAAKISNTGMITIVSSTCTWTVNN